MIYCTHLNSGMRFSEIRANKPLGTGKGVEQELFGGIVLIDGLAIVFTHKLEQPGALVLPNGSLVITVYHNLKTKFIEGYS